MIYSYINTNKVVKETVEDDLNIVSVAWNEYCNYSSMLESCTDENERAILEAKCEVLYEVSFKDIIEKIKEMWEKFKAWVKKVWNAIFHNKKATDKVADKVSDKVKKDMEDFSKEMEDEFSGKNKMKKAGVLADLKIPIYYADELDRLTDDSTLFKDGFASGGELMRNAKYTLDRILNISMTDVNIDIDNDEKDIHIHDHYEKSLGANFIKEDIETLQKEIEKVDNISIELVPIVENKNNNVFMINNRLEKYNIKFNYDDGVNEELLRKVCDIYNDILEGFKHDYVKVYGYKTQIDKNIMKWDQKIKQLLNNMHRSIDNYKKASKNNAEAKDELNKIVSRPYQDYKWSYGRESDLKTMNRRHNAYSNTKFSVKTTGATKAITKKDVHQTHDSIAAIRDLIRNLQKATNAISGLSAKIVSAEQKTTVQLGRLDKIILDMSDKAEKKDDNDL